MRTIKRELFFIWWRITAWLVRRRGEPSDLLTLAMCSPECIKATIRQLRGETEK